MTSQVLVIDDEPDIRELIEITLGRMNLTTIAAGTLDEARRLLATHNFQLCLTDMKLPDGDGLELVAEIQASQPQLPVAVITAYGSTDTAITALKSGAFDFVSKPVDLMKLRSLVQSALKLSTTATSAGNVAPGLVGESPGIRALRQQIAKLARSQAPVFISGESGSGKELVARAIHAGGPRKDRPFVAVNCGAVPTELMESEFFGHRKGSFTGADQDKPGLFQAAQGGSLFLDEIADLPLHMQVKLLRAIQEKSIRPVGSSTEIPVDVRLISATHKNLAHEVDAGRVRQDLYYRINVIELRVPPLRERLEDLPLLIEHILDRFDMQGGPAGLTPAALDALRDYPFPGNVRELENMLQRACAMAEGPAIEPADFPELQQRTLRKAVPPTVAAAADAAVPPAIKDAHYSLEKHLEAIERQEIEKALQESRWNRTAAARKLGMSFRSFRYRLKKLGLD